MNHNRGRASANQREGGGGFEVRACLCKTTRAPWHDLLGIILGITLGKFWELHHGPMAGEHHIIPHPCRPLPPTRPHPSEPSQAFGSIIVGTSRNTTER